MISSGGIKHNNELNINLKRKIESCKYNSCLSSFYLIKQCIINEVPLIEITKKYLDAYRDIEHKYKLGQKSVCYELFEAYYMYKNNIPINYKLARYLKYSAGILGSEFHFDKKYKFSIVFFSVKDIIKELDGDGFFIWLSDMCNDKFSDYYSKSSLKLF